MPSDAGKSEIFTNRELSWLDFNERVLSEARDETIPLFERMKFLSITASNLDEFFMIRVASLKDLVHADYQKTDISGMTPKEQLEVISQKTHQFMDAQYFTYNGLLKPMLEAKHLRLINSYEELNPAQKIYAERYFMQEVYPVLTPMAVDSSRPFPLIRNKTLNIGALISNKEGASEYDFATVQVPSVLKRLIEIPSEAPDERTWILLEQLIEMNIQKLFLNYKIICSYPYRIMRNADLSIDEEDAEDLLEEIEKQLKQRKWGEAIRLEVEKGMDMRLLDILKKALNVSEDEIYAIHGPLDFTFLMQMYAFEGFEHLKYPAYIPQISKELSEDENLFDQIRRRDILLFHPFQSFDTVVDFVHQASKDTEVLAIKQTLYRVSGHSPIIDSLAQAAENGKQVTVLVELKARFDEENNIHWAKKLEKAGCHVIYGLVGLKTHSKITLIVRREADGIRRYVHLGTGNYNDSTAKLYTDTGLFTCSKAIGEDATAVFNMLSGYSEPLAWNKLTLAPLGLRNHFLTLIHKEEENAKAGRSAHIIAKMNALCDEEIILALYQASAAGVKIELIVRGICCLKTGIPGLSENISVKSIVGNFLEHSRIFYFYDNGEEKVFMGSADWMPRNLDRRVEILFPVEDVHCKKQVIHILNIQLKDNVKSHYLESDNRYHKPKIDGQERISSQDYFCEEVAAL